MTSVNPAGAADRLLADSGYPAGRCLQRVSLALGATPSLMGHVTHTALQAWNEGTHNVPDAFPTVRGTPGFFSGADGDGDVSLWNGDGTWAAVDTKGGVYHAGVSGIQTTAQREKQLGGVYLGYQLKFLGYDVVSGKGILDMSTQVIRRLSADKTIDQSLWEFDYATKTFYRCDGSETYCHDQNVAAGFYQIFPVSDATLKTNYTDQGYKQVTPPVTPGAGTIAIDYAALAAALAPELAKLIPAPLSQGTIKLES